MYIHWLLIQGGFHITRVELNSGNRNIISLKAKNIYCVLFADKACFLHSRYTLSPKWSVGLIRVYIHSCNSSTKIGTAVIPLHICETGTERLNEIPRVTLTITGAEIWTQVAWFSRLLTKQPRTRPPKSLCKGQKKPQVATHKIFWKQCGKLEKDGDTQDLLVTMWKAGERWSCAPSDRLCAASKAGPWQFTAKPSSGNRVMPTVPARTCVSAIYPLPGLLQRAQSKWEVRGLERQLSPESACSGSMRTWAWICGTT